MELYQKLIDILDGTIGMTHEDVKNRHGFFFWNLLPWVTVTLYYIMVKFLPPFLVQMKKKNEKIEKIEKKVEKGKKKSFIGLSTLEKAMFIHNMLLAIYSGTTLFTVTVFFFFKWLFLTPGGWFVVVCDEGGVVANSHSFCHCMSYLFVLSKYWELLDSVFLIIKRPEREINFLHWYHHITVLLFTQYALYYELTVGYVFGTVNLLVHTLMYYYYAVALLGYRPSWAIHLTILQMVQMFFGLFILSLFFYFYITGYDCHVSRGVYVFFTYGFIMYGSYLYLFFSFFMKRYFGKKKKNERKAK